MEIAKRIRQRREELGLSQTKLAIRAGYADKTGISKIENEDRKLTVEKVFRIAKALEVSPFWLMGEDEPPKKKKTRRYIITIEEVEE